MTSLNFPLLRKQSLQVNTQKILYLKSAGSICYLKSVECENENGIPINCTLNNVEDMVTSNVFARTHRGYIVNLNHILDYGDYPKSKIELVNGEQLPLAKRRKLTFHKAYIDFKKNL